METLLDEIERHVKARITERDDLHTEVNGDPYFVTAIQIEEVTPSRETSCVRRNRTIFPFTHLNLRCPFGLCSFHRENRKLVMFLLPHVGFHG